jgi:alpha-galactosidase
MTKIKITLVGAGSRSFGPSSLRDILLSDPLNENGLHVVLMDKVAEHLTDIAAYAPFLRKKLGREAQISSTTDLEAAVDGADFVITAIDVQRFL